MKSYKKRSLVAVTKSFDYHSNYNGFYNDNQYDGCQQNINMIPKEMDMDKHSNAGKEKSSKKIPNWLNLQKKGTPN